MEYCDFSGYAKKTIDCSSKGNNKKGISSKLSGEEVELKWLSDR